MENCNRLNFLKAYCQSSPNCPKTTTTGTRAFLPILVYQFPILTCTFAAVGCESFRLKGIRCEAGTVPAAVSYFESIVIHVTFPDKSGLGRQQLFDESEDLPAKILDERTSGVRFRESPK